MNNNPFGVDLESIVASASGGQPAAGGGNGGSPSVAQFVQQYLPAAKRAAEKLGVDPSVLLGQWGLETGWGKSVIPGTNNLGNIKDFGGTGVAATDNMNGSRDKYRAYADADAFVDDFSGLLGRRYRGAVGAGANAQQYFTALKAGGYAEDPDYVQKGVSAAGMVANAIGAKPAAGNKYYEPRNTDLYTEKKAAPGATPFDFAKELAASAVEGVGSIAQFGGEVAAGVANKVTGTEDYEGFNPLKGLAESVRGKMSEGGKQARLEAAIKGDFFDPSSWETPPTAQGWGMVAANGFGSLASTLLPYVGQAGRIAQLSRAAKVAEAAGDTVKAAQIAADLQKAGAVTKAIGAGTGGAMTGGAAAEEARKSVNETIGQMSHEQLLAQVPAYAEVFAATGDQGQARNAVVNSAARWAGGLAALAGAAGGAFNAKIIEDAITKKGVAAMVGNSAGSRAGRAAIGAAGGMVAEGGQELTEKVGQNAGENIALGRPATEGVTRDTAGDVIGGAMVGGALGGGGGAISSPTKAPAAAPAPAVPPALAHVAEKAAEANSPLSKAAMAGSAAQQATAAAQPPAEPQVDPITAKVADIQERVRSGGLLDALRNADSPVDVKTFVADLAKAASPSSDPRQREMAMARMELALGWADQNPPSLTPAAGPAPTLEQKRAAVDRDAELLAQRDGAPNAAAASSLLAEAQRHEEAAEDISNAPGATPETLARADRLREQAADMRRRAAAYQAAPNPSAGLSFDRESIDGQRQANLEQRLRAPSPAPVAPAPAAPTFTPNDQAQLEAAAMAGDEANRRAEDAPRQAVLSKVMRNIEERGGVASPAEAQILAEAGAGKPYDRIDETLDGELTTDQKLTQATGIALDKAPRASASPANAAAERASQAAEQRAREDSAQDTQQRLRDEKRAATNAAAAAAATPASIERPKADEVIAALKTIPALRSAEQKVTVQRARSTYSADQMRVLEASANAPFDLTATDKLQLEQLRAGAPAPAPAAAPAPTGAGQPAAIRKRRAHLDQLAALGFETVTRKGHVYVLENTRTNQALVLEGAADAQLARQAIKAHIDKAASRADGNPTEAQKEAGNYRKGEPFQLNGVTIIIENERGSTRRGTSPDGTKWESKMAHHYGDVQGTVGADGDKVDVFVGPRPDSTKIYVIDQQNQDGSFDEHKVMMGFQTEAEARAGYLANYEPGWTGLRAITEMAPEQFRAWVKSDAAKKPAAEIFVGSVTFKDGGETITLPLLSDAGLGEEQSSPGRGGRKARITKKQAALLRQVGAAFGKQVHIFDDPAGKVHGSEGFVRADSTSDIYINSKASVSPLAIFGHELFHLVKRESPEVYGSIAKVVEAHVRDLEGFRQYYGDKEMSAELLMDELISDLGGNLMRDQKFWREVLEQIAADHGEKSKGLIASLASMVGRLLDAAIAAFKNMGGFASSAFIDDTKDVRNAFREGLAKYLKGAGITRTSMQAEILKAKQTQKKGAAQHSKERLELEVESGDAETQGRQDVTETESFKRWFGDSKVIDADGKPLVVFHGTKHDFSEFRTDAYDDLGAHFGTAQQADKVLDYWRSKKKAEGIHLKPVYLSIKNPLRLEDFGSFRPIAIVPQLQRLGIISSEPQNLLGVEAAYAVKRAIEEAGYDGVAYENTREGKGDSYIAFHPEQIKSAIGNDGGFDSASPDVTKSTDRNLERVDPMEVSTRAPYAKATKTFQPEDPISNLLIADFKSGLTQPKWVEAVTALVEQYPNYRAVRTANTPEKKLERMVRQMTDTLVWLHNQVPEATRQRSKLWYDGARAIAERMSKKYDVTPSQAAGILAVLSPQKDWFMNVSLAERVSQIMSERQAFVWSKRMDETADRIFSGEAYADDLAEVRGKSLAELDDDLLRAMWLRTHDEAHNSRSFSIISPEGDAVAEARTIKGEESKVAWGGLATIAKAISIYRNGSFENLNEQLGRQHKVRNFFNNILVPNSPNGHVTIDTHAVAAALLRPLSGASIEVVHNFGGPSSAHGGLQGTYALYEEAYNRAAREVGLLPREMQSITWEAVRGLFTPRFKGQARNVEAIDKIWTQFQKGRLSYEHARDETLESAGGIEEPSWAGRDPGAYAEDEPPADTGNVRGHELAWREAGAAAGRGVGVDPGTAEGDGGGLTPTIQKSADRAPYVWAAKEETEAGPIYAAKRFALVKPTRLAVDDFVEDDSVALPMGHAAFVTDGNTPYGWQIVDQAGEPVGILQAQVTPDGEIEAIHDIAIDRRGAGIGREIVAHIAANRGGDVRIIEALPQSQPFWDKVGAGYYDANRNTTLDWSTLSRAAAPAAAAGARQEAAEPAGAIPAGEAEELTDEEVAALGIQRSAERNTLKGAIEGAPDRLDGLRAPGWAQWVKANVKAAGVDALLAKLRVTNGKLSRAEVLSMLDADPTPPSDGGPKGGKPKRDVTDSEAFKKWFGDSKVVDGDSKPLVAYHGTPQSFDQFYRGEGGGMWFSSTPGIANKHAVRMVDGEGGNLMPVYLSIRNPVVIDATKGERNAAGAIDRAYKNGNDGVIMRGIGDLGEDGDVFFVFSPTQIKSAIGNDGTFDPASPLITKSSQRDFADTEPAVHRPGQWDTPVASTFDNLVYKLQDKHVDTKRVVDAVKEAGGEISDLTDVYLQEELFHGRAAKRTEDFVHDELQPLVDQMAKDGLAVGALDDYLHARHAKEANAVIAQRNPEIQDGGSGMTNQEAEAYFAELSPEQRAKLEAAAAKVDAMLTKTREMMVDYELESRGKVDGWASMFKHYVPLMREDDGGHSGGGTGQGFSIKGKEVKGRTGSTRKVVDILANIAMQRERTIVRGEKNRVSRALFGLAASNENPEFWQVDTHVPSEKVFNPASGQVEDRPDTMYKQRPNVVVTKMADEQGNVTERAVVFNEKNERAMRMAEALKNLDAAQLEGMLGASAKVTRYFAAINTQYNPVFGVVNLVRDVQAAMVNLQATELKGKQKDIARNALPALRGIYADLRAERNGKESGSPWAALWDEFQSVGGQTGYRQLFETSADRANKIKESLNPTAWMDSPMGKIFTANGVLKVPLAQAQRAMKWIFDWLSDYNEAMENGIRLATYKAGLDAGLSKERAASIAKNLTTNFNRKGQAAQQAGALYAFFNASMQGSARIAQTLFEMEPGKPKTIRLTSLGKKIVYGGMLLGTVQALAMAMAGFSDEDPPEFVRERGIVIPIGDKKYLTVPLPLGLHVIPGIGRITTEWALGGFQKTPQRAISLFGMFADAFNPIGNAGISMQTVSPTALDPFVALTENKDWSGRPIAKESNNKAMPGHLLARDTSTSAAHLLSEALNYLTGGTQHTAGAFSPTPDQIDYLASQLGGGVWREATKVMQTIRGGFDGTDVPTYKIPLVGRFAGDAKSQASEGTAFYANVDKLNELETEIKGLRKDGKSEEANELRMKSPQAYLITQANHAELAVQRLRREKSDLVRAGAPAEQVRAVEEKITARMSSLNRAMERLKETAE